MPVAVPLPKLLSLAAVYDVPVETLLARLPEPLRVQRLADLGSWRAEHRPIPERLIRVPHRHERTDAQLDELFAKKARGFTIDWEWKAGAERAVRDFLPYAVLPAFLQGSQGLALDFWQVHPPGDFPTIAAGGGGGGLALLMVSPWLHLVERFVIWATRATTAIEGAMRLVSWWTLDFTTSGAACHFTAPELDACYGFDSVPPMVVIAVRRLQLARFLSQHGAPATWPAPPDPIEGARLYIDYLLRPQPFLPDDAPDAPTPAATICDGLVALRARVPALEAVKTPVNQAILEGVASLLNRAADQPTPPRSTRKPRPRRAAPRSRS